MKMTNGWSQLESPTITTFKEIDWYKFPDEIADTATTVKEAVEYIQTGDQIAIINHLESNDTIQALAQEVEMLTTKLNETKETLFTSWEIFYLILIGIGCVVSVVMIRNYIRRKRLARNNYLAEAVQGAL